MTALVDLARPACPSGGCKMFEGMGTCARVMGTDPTGKDRRFCRGWGGFVCTPAFEDWERRGRPMLSDDELRAVAGERAEQPAGTFRRYVPESVEAAPASLDAWELWAPRRIGTSGRDWAIEQRRARDAVGGLVTQWRAGARPDTTLLFLGDTGTGKTLLARIAGKLAWMAGLDVRFAVFDHVLKAIKATRAHGSMVRESEVARALIEADLLIWDEIRPVFDSQDDENICHEIISARYGEDRGRRGRPTIITSNLSKAELARVVGAAGLRRLLDCSPELEAFPFDWPAYPRRRT